MATGVTTGDAQCSVSENTTANPGDWSSSIWGVVPWPKAEQRLTDGEYTIRNRFTTHQWALWDDSDPAWVVAPLLLFHGNPGHQNIERRFRIDVNSETGTVEITSTFYRNGEGPRRWLSDGPNFRPNRNVCRLYGVPGVNSAFFICTDVRTENSPVMALQDIHKSPRDRLLAISVPLDPRDERQQWVFTPVKP